MKKILFTVVLLLGMCSIAYPQMLKSEIHERGMLRQTEYNTGEIGKGFARTSQTDVSVTPSFEWPKATPHWRGLESPINLGSGSSIKNYNGFYNSLGGGIWMAADTSETDGNASRVWQQCGAVTYDKGKNLATIDLFSFPVSITKDENFPLNADGSINGGYLPDKPEETITAIWDTRMGITITRTSYAWSWPGYDDFIIYEYELENTGRRGPGTVTRMETLTDMAVAFAHGLTPSMFAMQQRFNQWSEGDARTSTIYPVYSRFDVKRWLSYNIHINGYPESILNQSYFDVWSSNRATDPYGLSTANGGGLAAPGAVGYMPLYYDYDHLSTQDRTRWITTASDNPANASNMWDVNLKMKQPYHITLQNGNLDYSGSTADYVYTYLNGAGGRSPDPFSITDSTYLAPYWIGRGKSTAGFTKQPVSHIYTFGPYIMMPGDKMHFAVAEVAGYGAGVASDSVYRDYGGSLGNLNKDRPAGVDFRRVPSWYKIIYEPWTTVAGGANPVPVGSDYLQTHPLPWYVDTPVVSIRDVADRAIQMYTGRPLVKYELSQYEPSPVNLEGYPVAPYPGVYNSVPIPCPAPVISVNNLPAVNEVTWGNQVEALTNTTPGWSRLNAPLKYYLVMRTVGPNMLGPWVILDIVQKQDTRYLSNTLPCGYKNDKYSYYDQNVQVGTWYYYTVLSVDTLGGKSGMTNIIYKEARLPAVSKMAKVYASPNPFIITSHYGDNTNKIQFLGLPKHATIRIFSFGGQLVQTIEHNVDSYGSPWYQISRTGQWLASGVYYFTVDDHDTGDRAWNKFVIIH